MLKIENLKQFKKDLKRYQHRKEIIKELDLVIRCLANLEPLEGIYKDHSLTGNWTNHRECHVKNDVLLIYRTDQHCLFLERIGSHAELFG